MEHYYSKEQSSTVKLKEIKSFLRGEYFYFYLSSGLFSKSRIDFGTYLLCEKMIIKKEWTVLDLGCGAGIVGIVASRLAKKVYLSDVNSRACEISRLNLKLNNVNNALVVNSDLFENLKGITFDCILLNPPQSAGKKICFKMIEQSIFHLNKGGVLEIVARHNKGGKSLSEKMKEVFSNADYVGKSGGYRVYVSSKS